MVENLVLFLPFPPTINSYYLNARSGGRYISNKGRQYRDAVETEIIEQVPGLTLDEKLHVEVVVYMPDKRTRDLDNYMKPLLDALTHAELWKDDSLIDQLPIYRGVTTKGGLITLEVSEAGPLIPLPAHMR